MNPSPIFELECSKENKRLKDKVAIITGETIYVNGGEIINGQHKLKK